jgi:cell division protein FtsI/penicillin-binding protein 2
MQDTVNGGTAAVLDLPGVQVGAKTGTAEYGTESPPRTHAWMVGFRGDLAFAVLVEDGESGSKSAGPIARRFLQAAT